MKRAVDFASLAVRDDILTLDEYKICAAAVPSTNSLQEFILPKSQDQLALYVRKLEGELAFFGGLSTYGPAALSFNTYLNSFYEDYWVKHTSVSTIVLRIAGEGMFWCNIYRETALLGCNLIGRHLVDVRSGDTPEVCIPIELIPQGHGHGGRIFADLHFLCASKITEMQWRTSDKPMQEVALGVGICTFNREAFVVRTVGAVLAAPAEAAVSKVVVVNQGRSLGSEAFETLAKRAGPRLSVREQPNFGGAGGFTRSAIELLDDPSITHLLFMDDDIELDARHLVTTAAFLRYAKKPIILGGHMLDLFRRNVLYEAGNAISPDNQLRPNHHNRDLFELASLTALSRATPSHFNGWWYAAMPVKAFRELGLPMPIFIRGDDLEYGTRLHRAGIDTVALPPVSVWHEPFYAKAPGWQLYYDLRNRLIFASLHGDLFALDSPTRLLKLLMVHIIKYDYQHAWFMMAAINDFMKGPSLLDEGLPQIHARLMRDSAALAPERMTAALGVDDASSEHPARPWPLRRRMVSSLLRAMTGNPRRGALSRHYSDVHLQWVKLASSYILSDREEHFFLRFTYSRQTTWSQTAMTTRAIMRYAKHSADAAAAWKAAYPRLISHDNWREMLGLVERGDETHAKAA